MSPTAALLNERLFNTGTCLSKLAIIVPINKKSSSL